MPKMTRLAVVLAGGLVVVVAIVAALWWFMGRQRERTELSLYGNVDLRQVELPFNDSERIATVLVQEGDHVKRGQVVAELDTGRLVPQVNQARAQVDQQRQVVDRLHNGSRLEEIAQARANVAQADADAKNALRQYDRMRTLFQRSKGEAISQTDVDN